MSIQISINPDALSKAQREAVASFILAYPAAHQCGGKGDCHSEHVDTEVFNTTTMSIERVPVHPDMVDLVRYDGEFQASVAFGKSEPNVEKVKSDIDEAHVRFGNVAVENLADNHFMAGSAPIPPLPGATAAPFTADAVRSPTVPADIPVLISMLNMNVPLPPVPNVPGQAAQPAYASASNPVGGVELDKNGLPWDMRIHASTKRKNADGTWTAKRGVDAALVDTVEAELQALMGVPAPLSQGSALSPAQQAAPATIPTVGPASSVATVSAPLSSQTIAPQPPAPSADARQQFVALVGRTAAALQAQKISQAEVTQCCSEAGVPALPLLANRLDLIEQVARNIDTLIAARS